MSEKNPAEANTSSGVASATTMAEGATTSAAETPVENDGGLSSSGASQSAEINDRAAKVEGVSLDGARLIPVAQDEASSNSYSMLEPRMKKVYGAYYKELYYTPERRILDPKVQELISIAASLVAKCDGCIDGHMKKALSLGATKEEISETICIAAAINAAAMIDLSDRTAARLGLNHFPTQPPKKADG
ncbi:MAG TPA: carboxymuconolactone decarboxylase family protein [Pyrinomonadaceae bacterium]|jgi:AhpD family alkylhydroperoxidase|nr:carboxymuconolactone decarboxylase family protein [Pyrinomonadaceae bacterium]